MNFTPTKPTQSGGVRPALKRPRNRILAGVSEAVANHLGWSVNLVRLIFVLSNLSMGAGALLYLWLWAFTPSAEASSTESDNPITRRLPVAFLLTVGSIVMGIIVLSTAGSTLPIWWLLLWATSTGAVIWTVRMDRTDPLRTVQQQKLVLYAAPLYLIFFGIAVTAQIHRFQTIEITLGFFTILLGIILLVAPPISERITARLEQQAELAKANQRAEIAAHLHDSVLQTLALIQNRAGAASEVSRIARAQERELRDWLYSGSAPIVHNLTAELKEVASDLELEYEVVFDVVSVGDTEDNIFEEGGIELLAATKEAMLNAARHAGGNVSVYLESTEQKIDVYVRDRGQGFDPDQLPDDRFGVRNSIIGRMSRVGGNSKVTSKPGEGTEIHLTLPKS